MSNTLAVRPSTARQREARYVAWGPASTASRASFCKGNTMEEMLASLERLGAPGRYRVFDRHPSARGIDLELVGVFLVGDDAAALWMPLQPL